MTETLINLQIRRITPEAILPTKGTEDAACWDVYACILSDTNRVSWHGMQCKECSDDKQHIRLNTNEYAVLGTGLHLYIPAGYEVQVRPRSGLAAKHGITIINSPGTIDADYRNKELMIILRNEGPERFTVCHGDRIAQILLNKLTPTSVTEYFEDAPLLSSRAGGLGSTGR